MYLYLFGNHQCINQDDSLNIPITSSSITFPITELVFTNIRNKSYETKEYDPLMIYTLKQTLQDWIPRDPIPPQLYFLMI